MRHNRNRLFGAVRYALLAGVASGVATQAAVAQDEDTTELDRIEVTGSRISRADVEAALPVFVIDRETIEFSGQTSVADLMRDLPFATAGSFRPQSGSSAQSFAGIDLRGLGEGRTLVLIDGRRAPVAPNVGQGQDLNSIPLAAVERIEILSDGSSAVYGADAIGGVVNIITRKDFTGAELSYTTSSPEREGGDIEQGSALFGFAGERGQIMAGVSFNSRDIIFARDREWSRGGASIFSNNFLTENFSFLDNPEFGSANVPGCQGPGFSVNGARCAYDFTLVSADEAAIDNESFFVRSRYDLNEDWSILMNATLGRVKSFGRYAPVPSSPWLVGGFGAIVLSPGLPNHPATPPSAGGLNPNWQSYQDVSDDIILLTHRFAANGPRDTETDANLYDFDIGVQGRVAGWDVEARARKTVSQYYELGRNYIVSALAQPQFDSGAYNIYDPFNVPTDVLQSFTATINRDAEYNADELFVVASGEVFDLPAGPLGVAFGAEYRDEEYTDLYDDLQANGNITGSAGNSAGTARDYTAVFGEALVPITDQLELNFAARWDDYSDFGNEVSPKVAFRWQPLDQLVVRGSWGEGFRAPPLDTISAQPSFSADTVFDPPTCIAFGSGPNCEPTVQINAFVIGNPNLEPEESEQFGLGVAFEPLDWLNGSLDYYNIEIDGRTAAIGSGTIIGCLNGTLTNCPPGLSNLDPSVQPPAPELGLGVARNPETGQIDFLQRGFANLGTLETSGIDFNLRTNFDFGNAGRWNSELQGTYLLEYIIDGGDDAAGGYSLPEYRFVWRNVYGIGDFSFAANVNYIDEQNEALASTLDGVDSWTTVDLQANYFAPWDGQFTLGMDNVADEDPPLDPGEGRGFNFGLYDGYGRVIYARYTQSF